ncbi:MAG TPA: hypothetical protein PK349_01400 [Candidatus Hydrogenedentes bacterium]|nr:hypothetical protein [Candidatus Hydrogenedentota bacterium]
MRWRRIPQAGLCLAGCLLAWGAGLTWGEAYSTQTREVTVNLESRNAWQEWVPDSGWFSRLEALSGGPPPESVLGNARILAGAHKGRLVCLSSGLRGSNWFSGAGGQWLLELNGDETAIGEPDWNCVDRNVDPAGQRVIEIWQNLTSGVKVRLTWQVDVSGSSLECEAEEMNPAPAGRLTWDVELAPEAPFTAAWSGVFRGGMETAWVPVPGVSDTFIAVAAWLPDAASRSRWEEIEMPGLEDLKEYQRADRFDRDIPGKVLGWRIAAGAVQEVRPAEWGMRGVLRNGRWRTRIRFPAGAKGFIRYATGDDPAEVLEACMVRRQSLASSSVTGEPSARTGIGSPDLLELATDPDSGITVAHPGRGHFFRVTRPDWAWFAAREWWRRRRPDRAAAQLEPFLNRFNGTFMPSPNPLNAPAMVNVAGEPVLPRVFDSFGDTAIAVLAAADLLNDKAFPMDRETRSRWLAMLEQAVWSMYWQSNPEDGTPPPVFHPGAMLRVMGDTDWITALAVLESVEPMYRKENGSMPSEWREWRRVLETRIRFRLREGGERYAWPTRAAVVMWLLRCSEPLNLPDLARLNAAGIVFPHRMIRAVVPEVQEALIDGEFGSRMTMFSAMFRSIIGQE